METVIVAGPPFSGVEHTAAKIAQEKGWTLIDGDSMPSKEVHEWLNDKRDPAVVMFIKNAYIVHIYNGNHVYFVRRDTSDIQRELDLAEYEDDITRRIMAEFDQGVLEYLDCDLDFALPLPELIYEWAETQKGILEYWGGTWEWVDFNNLSPNSRIG
jgi:hypothetical protein